MPVSCLEPWALPSCVARSCRPCSRLSLAQPVRAGAGPTATLAQGPAVSQQRRSQSRKQAHVRSEKGTAIVWGADAQFCLFPSRLAGEGVAAAAGPVERNPPPPRSPPCFAGQLLTIYPHQKGLLPAWISRRVDECAGTEWPEFRGPSGPIVHPLREREKDMEKQN